MFDSLNITGIAANSLNESPTSAIQNKQAYIYIYRKKVPGICQLDQMVLI